MKAKSAGSKPPVILLVDDDKEFADLIRVRFEEIYGHPFRWAKDFDEGAKILSETPGDMVAFVDIHLGRGKSGFEFLRYIQQNAPERVVAYVVTGSPVLTTMQKSLEAGAINVFNKAGFITDDGVVIDIKDMLVVYAEAPFVKRLLKGAYQDELTGFLNWWGFKDRVISEMQVARDHYEVPEERRAGKYPEFFSLILIDILKLKSIGDKYGARTADEVVAAVAEAIKSQARPTDHICRKEEEFLIMMPGARSARVEEVEREIRNHIARSVVEVNGEELPIFLEVGTSQRQSQDLGENLRRDVELLIAGARRSRRRVSCHIHGTEL